jgi:succinoglycan biosynthesis protein ExoA
LNETSYNKPLLSVIVPVRNEAEHIADVLQQILAQTLEDHRYEILVVDGRSEDGTAAIVAALAEKHPMIRLLDNPNFLSGEARNIGVQNARGDFVVFVDGHCRIKHPDMLKAVAEAAERGEKCISRPQFLIDDDVTPYQQAVSLARSSVIGHYAGSQIFRTDDSHCNPMSAGCGYDRQLYSELGGVDTSFDAAEDLEFNYRVHRQNVEAFHSGAFEVNYYPRRSFRGLFRQLYRYGYGRALMARKHSTSISILGLINALMGLGLWLLPILGLMVPALMRLWLLIAIPYLGISGLVSAWQARDRDLRMFLMIWSCFPAIHFGAGFGYLSGLLGGPSLNHKPDNGN